MEGAEVIFSTMRSQIGEIWKRTGARSIIRRRNREFREIERYASNVTGMRVNLIFLLCIIQILFEVDASDKPTHEAVAGRRKGGISNRIPLEIQCSYSVGKTHWPPTTSAGQPRQKRKPNHRPYGNEKKRRRYRCILFS